ncbi:MAG: DivIVA domain-containing protein [Firmicutes bacterium]|nr:DivIVA domain-containing protein [Bacillota bacterium]
MKLTPLDIHHKEFHRSIRGYNEEEVDKFLDEVAEEFERLFKENIELKEEIEKSKQDLENYVGMEKTLQNALLTAQKSAEDITAHAQKEAELIKRDAELKAKEILQEAYDLKRKYETTLNHLKQAEEEFRSKFKNMLESYMRIADSTAALADIGNNIIGLNDEPPVDLDQTTKEQELPKLSVAKSEEKDIEAEDLLSGSFTGETYVPDDFMEVFPGSSEPSFRAPLKDARVTKDSNKIEKSDYDKLAF